MDRKKKEQNVKLYVCVMAIKLILYLVSIPSLKLTTDAGKAKGILSSSISSVLLVFIIIPVAPDAKPIF